MKIMRIKFIYSTVLHLYFSKSHLKVSSLIIFKSPLKIFILKIKTCILTVYQYDQRL